MLDHLAKGLHGGRRWGLEKHFPYFNEPNLFIHGLPRRLL
jgi:hypothetical protein